MTILFKQMNVSFRLWKMCFFQGYEKTFWSMMFTYHRSLRECKTNNAFYRRYFDMVHLIHSWHFRWMLKRNKDLYHVCYELVSTCELQEIRIKAVFGSLEPVDLNSPLNVKLLAALDNLAPHGSPRYRQILSHNGKQITGPGDEYASEIPPFGFACIVILLIIMILIGPIGGHIHIAPP
jgi:hypothetical protein